MLFRDLFRMLHSWAQDGDLGEAPDVRSVDRRAADELSVRDFIEGYAKKGLPVIITGLNLSQELMETAISHHFS